MQSLVLLKEKFRRQYWDFEQQFKDRASWKDTIQNTVAHARGKYVANQPSNLWQDVRLFQLGANFLLMAQWLAWGQVLGSWRS